MNYNDFLAEVKVRSEEKEGEEEEVGNGYRSLKLKLKPDKSDYQVRNINFR